MAGVAAQAASGDRRGITDWRLMDWFFGNPKMFNYVILTLYGLNSC